MPLISVIIPAYNAEKTIRETIKSVIGQTFVDWELIVVNDGSQDRTLEVASQINDSRIKVFSYSNAGASASRNRGFEKSAGEYIAFLDADDLWTPDKLESQLNALQSHPEAGVAYSWTDYIDEFGRFLNSGWHLSYSGDVYSKLLVRNFLESGSNMLIKRGALNEAGGFDESLMGAEERDLSFRLAVKCDFISVKKIQVLYRQHINSKSISSNTIVQEHESLRIIARGFNNAPASLQHLKKYALADMYQYLIWKTIKLQPTLERRLAVARFLWFYFINTPICRSELKFIYIIFVKSLEYIVLPAAIYQKMFNPINR